MLKLKICDLALGEWAILKVDSFSPIIKKAWPTTEKTLTSVHLTKPVLDLYFGNIKNYPNVSVTKLNTKNLLEAQQIILISKGLPKTTEITQDIQKRLTQVYKGTLLTTGNKISIFYYGKNLKFLIKEVTRENRDLETELRDMTISDTFYEVTQKTKWIIFKDSKKIKDANEQSIVPQIGGLDEEIKEIRRLINIAVVEKQKPIYRSVLLYGYPGTGKTMLANALARESGANLVSIKGPISNDRSEESIETIFQNALDNSPTVIVVDDLDTICPKTTKSSGSEKQSTKEFWKFFEKLQNDENAKVFVIGTTSNIDNVDPSLRKVGRFQKRIEIPVPNPMARKDILDKILSGVEHDLSEDQLSEISFCTHGYVGGDLLELCDSARDHASLNSREVLEIADLKFGLTQVIPSAMREVQVEVSKVKWSDIGGQDDLKLILQQAVEWPLKYPESFQNIGITPPNSVLMYGPPGCSKTMIAKAIATESRLNFLSIKGPELFSKWVGESEKAVRDVFQKARQVAPSIIFFDEIDAIGGERSSGSSSGDSVQVRVLLTLLTEMNGISPLGNVIVLAATNRPDRIDKALLRAGRFSKRVYVPLPNDETRKEIFKLNLRKIPVDSEIDIQTLVDSTKGYSGAEVAAVCFEAGLKALEDNIHTKVVEMKHFEVALKNVLPITSEESLRLYEEFGAAPSKTPISPTIPPDSFSPPEVTSSTCPSTSPSPPSRRRLFEYALLCVLNIAIFKLLDKINII
ncbi:ATPase family protein 2 homolog isoform X2 [Coccinella septempunctata]|uniref:ATPase family protein 2 homolog isoform X2 n=1 Tax=Coccinella septempunctata TaxID=41139 RepID=UPI001D08E383|nr:ATPase family protein 2 homolog isoform X2 [Coccinella septempunctata]